MKDPIERQDAIEAICRVCPIVADYHKCDGYPETSTWCDELVALRAVPSAQPELVWCKDCEHWYTEEDEDDEYGYCRNHEFWTCGIWFCADGERRTNG